MKRLFYSCIAFVLLTGLISCESQKKISDIIYSRYNNQPGFTMMALPPNFVDNFINEDQKEEQELLNQVRDFRIMVFDDEIEGKDGRSVFEDVNNLLEKRNFEEMMSITKSGARVTVKIQQRKDLVREMHVLVRGEEKFFIASLTGRIDLNTISNAINEIEFDDFHEIEGFTKDFDFDPEDFKIKF